MRCCTKRPGIKRIEDIRKELEEIEKEETWQKPQRQRKKRI
jgi:hypothetical protein